MIRFPRRPSVLAAVLLLLAGCASPEAEETAPVQPALFASLPPSRTGIDFANNLSEGPTPHRNVLTYEYFSNGAGVAVGDLNGDGLDDLFFTGNMTYDRLYLNRGGLAFEDVTRAAGVGGRKDTWKTGATMADVNGDGLLDLYVCYSGNLPLDRRVDELLINQGPDAAGIPRFEDQAAAYGLDRPHSSNQAYFFDYDRDGDLDLFLLTHNVQKTPRRDREGTREQLETEDPVSGIRFYENRGGHFEDVTRAVGIQSSELTYGLGAGVSDLDKDGRIDLYVGNDYSPPDYLYMNAGGPGRRTTFVDEIQARTGHTSRASMGVDVADVDNDAWPDIVVLDMLGASNLRQKVLFVPDDRSLYRMAVQAGFHHQYMRNTLQLNNGDGTFSEIGQLAGISNTDWSWAPLLADYDNDGRKDLFVTNGVLYDMIDRDFMDFKRRYMQRKGYELVPEDVAFMMSRLPSTTLRSYAFRNGGALRFEDVSAAWGLDSPAKSNGAAYADLDNDGDLDLVTNNVNGPASVFENRAADLLGHHYLAVDLAGSGKNTFGIGAKLTLYAGGALQYLEQVPMRGYLSTVSPTLHFGLGRQARVDSLHVVWPDGSEQTLRDVAADRRLTVRQAEARGTFSPPPPPPPAFEAVPPPIAFEHRMAGEIDDFRRQPLLVEPPSFAGPPLAAADVDGDGREDVFVGGGDGQAGALYLQRAGGRFTAAPAAAFEADRRASDLDAAFADVDGDGDADLYVAGGGYGYFAPDDPALQDRLYLNDGAGRFTRAEGALPEMRTSTGAVAPADVDGDGDLDLFVGGYVIPGRYPEPPRSYVLLNDGRGGFEDRTAEVAPALADVGMVRDAVWHDLDGDGAEELVVAGAWMPIRVFERAGGTLADATDRYFDRPYSGLWNVLLVEDVSGDGVPDLVAGNLGLNTQLHAAADEPAELYYGDFNGDGEVDPILNFYLDGASYPYLTLDELTGQLPFVGRRFPSHAAYGRATLRDVFTDEELRAARKLEARHLETSLFLGREGGGFEKADLPVQAQFSPVFALQTTDYDGDGHTDLLLAGNMSEARIRFGKYDANYGVLLRGRGGASFAYVPQSRSGFSLRGDVRSVIRVGDRLLFGLNRGPLRAYAPRGR